VGLPVVRPSGVFWCSLAFLVAARAYQVTGRVRFQIEAILAVVVNFGLARCDYTHIPFDCTRAPPTVASAAEAPVTG
jgi:hypothetical protein